MLQARGYVLLRAVEVALGALIVAALVVALNSGWLTGTTQRFSDWYALQVDGLVNITVVSTAVTLPQVERADLPIPQFEAPAFSASNDGVTATPSLSAD